MNTRKLVYLFFSTLLIGASSGVIVGVLLDLDTYFDGGFLNFFFGVLWMFGISAAISLVAQMGYFAYLTLHRFALGVFKSVKLWNRIQVVLILFVLFDLIYLRYYAFASEEETLAGYAIMPVLLFMYCILVAYWKRKETNRGAFIPALFFMFVVTTIEWVPALTVDIVNDTKWLWIYVTPLLTANTWQLLILHRLTGVPNEKQSKSHSK
ncbi:KinB signaling pathway activation protein [Alteribacillus persepolensis]|uniref:KinB signaling pathway activation protein n=1 Tax=Alteribacillus persepolensis TaxID=568899 RepID=A0A1G8HMU1_9BACI|nr:KinB-signaling pathway activation protein [Alteribacillus persepolensis]SDI07925.1 KinB signaling pathway activation protein [Alteribacillus persepolensis]